jgi:hypothetical protein
VRKALFALVVVPILVAWGALFLAIWPTGPAVRHMVLLAVTGFLMVELSLSGFRKIPFTCSYLPGKANLHVKLAWISHRVCSGSRGAAQTRSLQRRGPKTTYTPVTCIMPGCWRTSRAAPEHAGRTGFMARRPCCAWPTGLTKYFN